MLEIILLGALILSLLIAWCAFGFMIEVKIEEHLDLDFITPETLHDNTKLNWFGCILVFLCISIISPLGLLIKVFDPIWKIFGIIWQRIFYKKEDWDNGFNIFKKR